jgi:hypothetical protein
LRPSGSSVWQQQQQQQQRWKQRQEQVWCNLHCAPALCGWATQLNVANSSCQLLPVYPTSALPGDRWAWQHRRPEHVYSC